MTERDEVIIRLPNMLAWLREHVPDEFVGHMRNAQREQLLAMRSLIDAAIERTEQAEARQREKMRTEITVE